MAKLTIHSHFIPENIYCNHFPLCLYHPEALKLFITSIKDGLIGDLQHETQLWVHGVGLLGMDSKESCIKVAYVLQFTIPLWKTIKT